MSNPKGKRFSLEANPWSGDAPEREWAANVCERIRTKAKGLASGRWTPADAYDLVLYENGSYQCWCGFIQGAFCLARASGRTAPQRVQDRLDNR